MKFGTISRLTGAVRIRRVTNHSSDSPYSWDRPLPPWVWIAWSSALSAASEAANFAILAYTKLLNSNNMADQAAVVILASAQAATRLRIPSERWVFPYAGTDAHDTYAIAERADYRRSPAIRIAGRRASTSTTSS
jgi:acetyl-CoA C-acetyltransferase